MDPMIGLDEAQALLARAVAPLPAVTVPVDDALGCRLAGEVVARLPLPSTDVAAMDGYAARRDDLPGAGTLPVAFTVAAGDHAEPLPSGAAARIYTGAMLPPGADVVVPQENAGVVADGVRLPVPGAWSHVRRQGELVSAGAPIGQPGDRVTPARLGLLAAAAVDEVAVVRRPRVAVIATGSELVPAGAAPRPGQLRDSNGSMLAALARAAGLPLAARRRADDQLPALREALSTAADGSDLILTSGGVSVGDLDLVPQAIRELGGETLFHGVAIRPGKPTLAARLGQAWLVGLPGNPLSCLIGWRLFALPLAQALAADPHAFEEVPLSAALLEPLANPGDRLLLRPAGLAPDGAAWSLQPLPWKGSHDVVAAGACNAIARVEPGRECAAGELVGCYRLWA